MAQAPKSPPFAKGGLGGFYTYTYTYAYTAPCTTASPLLCAERCWRAGDCWGCGAVFRQRGVIPPTSLLRKGGFFGACASFASSHHHYHCSSLSSFSAPSLFGILHRHSGVGRNPEPRWRPGLAVGRGADSRFRGNDGGGREWWWGIVRYGRAVLLLGVGLIPPTPLLRKGGFLWLAPSLRLFIIIPISIIIPYPLPSFRRKQESRAPVVPGLSIGQVWIPAFAGMTNRAGRE